MSVRLAIQVLGVKEDGTLFGHAIDYGRLVNLRPGEAKILVPAWPGPAFVEYMEISDEVALRELGNVET